MRPKDLFYIPMKRYEMEEGVTYYLCPDKTCDIFWNETGLGCENDCPKVDELKKILYFESCQNLIVLLGNHSVWESVRYETDDGRNPLFFRNGMVSHIIYDMPK